MRLLAILFTLSLTGCELGKALLPQQATHGYVGRLRTEEPRNLGSDNYEVTMHFSGGLLELDSAICFHHAEAKVAGRMVQLKVYTGLCGRRSPRNHTFRVKGLTQDEYDLVYVDPDGTKHAVGALRLKADP